LSSEKREDLRLYGHVKRRGGLVRDQDIGPVGQRYRDHHPLPLPARELMRIGVQAAFRLADAHPLEQLHDPGPCRIAGQPLVQLEALAELLFQRVQRVERGHRLLEDIADIVAAHLSQPLVRGADHLLAGMEHAARHLRRRPQQRNQRQRRHRLAQIGRASCRERV